VLHHIAVRPFFEQPAGKAPPPLVGAMFEHQHLHKRPGFRWHFPLRRAFATAQPHNHPADADALTGFQRNVPHQPVTFI
jgi:hypothetical protein